MADTGSDRDILLNRLADEFAARYRRGERPSLLEYIGAHPDLANDIRDLFPALVEMEQAKEDGPKVGSDTATPPLERLGDFRILRQIGQGGMGVVYEAEQVSLGRHVAIKVLSQKIISDARQKRRFEREAKAAAKLHHTNIVPVHGVGEHDGIPFYVMQFIQGLGLDQVIEELRHLRPAELEQVSREAPSGNAPKNDKIRPSLVTAAAIANSLLSGFRTGPDHAMDAYDAESRGSPGLMDTVQPLPTTGRHLDSSSQSLSSVALPGHDSGSRASGARAGTYWHSVAQIGTQVAEALDYAHNQGVLHRDIKPSNLLLDTRGTVWVTDFGLAKADDQQNLTQSGDLLGTLRYMPPEAFDGKSDRRSDVYGLGLTLYELLVLRPAFNEQDRHRLIKQVTTVDPPPLDRLCNTIPRDMVTVVHKAIDQDPDRRYATAGELAADLRRFLADEPILARRPSTREQVVRWARHHPGVARSLAVIGLLLLAATIASLIAAGRFRGIARERGNLANQNARLAALKEEERQKAVDAQKEAEGARDEAKRRGDAERWERYRANIAAAVSAMWVQNAAAARRYLNRAPEQHRNWEWRYLNSQLSGARHVLVGHSGQVMQLKFSSDGRWLASGSRDGTVRLWDAASGREVAVLCKHTESTTALQTCPVGTLLISVTYDNANQSIVQAWDAASAREIWSCRIPGYSSEVVFSEDGKYVGILATEIIGTAKGRLIVWDTVTEQQVVALHADNSFSSVKFRPGKRQFARAWGAHVRIWDFESGRDIVELAGENNSLLCLSYSSDGKRIAAGFGFPENKIRIWDAESGQLITDMAGHTNSVMTVAFRPDGTRLASCSLDQTVRVWDGMTGEPITTLRGHTGDIRNIEYTPDGKYLLSAASDGTVRMWDGETGDFVAVLSGVDGQSRPVAISPDGRSVATGSEDKSIRLWDTEQVARNGVLRSHTRFVYDVAVSPDGRQIASAAWDGTVRLWDLATDRQSGLLRSRGDLSDHILGSVAYHPDGRRLVSVSRDERVHIWDLATGAILREIQVRTGNWNGDARAAFNRAGTLLAVGSAKGIVHLFNPESGELMAALSIRSDDQNEETSNIRDVAFSPDGTVLAIPVYDHTVRIWDAAKLTERLVLHGHANQVYAVTFSVDGRLLATADRGGTVCVWDATTFQELNSLPHRGAVYGLAFNPDGTRLATACADNSIRLWDVATWQEVAELRGHELYVHAVAWSPDGTLLISGSGDATVRIWNSRSSRNGFSSGGNEGGVDRSKDGAVNRAEEGRQ